jgi:hypothetical protein
MQGVTAAIVAFILLALGFPSLIKNEKQYYAGFGAILVVILLDTLAHIVPADSSPSFHAFCYVMAGLAQIISLIMVFMSTGGVGFRQLQDNFIEVMRRGDATKEVIVPLSDEMRRMKAAREQAAANRTGRATDEPTPYTIDAPTHGTGPAANVKPPPGPIPLE